MDTSPAHLPEAGLIERVDDFFGLLERSQFRAKNPNIRAWLSQISKHPKYLGMRT